MQKFGIFIKSRAINSGIYETLNNDQLVLNLPNSHEIFIIYEIGKTELHKNCDISDNRFAK